MHHALAARNEIGIDLERSGHGRQFVAQINDVLMAHRPVGQELEDLGDLVSRRLGRLGGGWIQGIRNRASTRQSRR